MFYIIFNCPQKVPDSFFSTISIWYKYLLDLQEFAIQQQLVGSELHYSHSQIVIINHSYRFSFNSFSTINFHRLHLLASKIRERSYRRYIKRQRRFRINSQDAENEKRYIHNHIIVSCQNHGTFLNRKSQFSLSNEKQNDIDWFFVKFS